jgi:MFS family permease
VAEAPQGATLEQFDVGRATWATRFVFAANGGLFATWVSRIPAVRDDIGATERGLGFALLFVAVGSLIAMPLSGRLVTRVGVRRVLVTCIVTCVLGYSALGLAPDLVVIAVVLLVLGAGVGVWDVAMNVSAHAVEVRAGRTLMPGFHAAWSIGTVVGAGIGALAAKAGVEPAVQFTLCAGVVGVVAVLAVQAMPDRPADEPEDVAQPAGDSVPAPDVAAPDVAAPDVAAERHVPRHSALIRDPRVLGLGLMTFCAAWAEGAANDWLALMLTDDRDASAALAALGFAVFAGAMTLGRSVGNQVVARLGRVRSLRTGAVIAALGVTGLLATDSLPAAYTGALLWGLGISIAFPLAMSAAGETPGRGASAIATVATIAYAGFLVGPPLLGSIAHETSLDVALWAVVLLAVGIFVLAGSARSPRRAADGGRAADGAAPGTVGGPRDDRG